MKILGKVKHMMWRTFTRCLPSKVALIHKGVSLNPYYSVCGLRTETNMHVFLECSFARQCWDRFGIGYVRGGARNMKEWFELASGVQSLENLCSALMLYWAL